MTYRELKQKHREEINAFPFMFAFSNKQFIEGMAKLGLEPGDTDKIYDMFYTELANHEYIITGDLEPTLEALDLSLEEINSSKALLHGLKKAMAAQNEYS